MARRRCPAGHELPRRGRGLPGLPPGPVVVDSGRGGPVAARAAVIEAAVDAVAPGGQALWHLEQALAAGPQALSLGAPPLAGPPGRRADRPRVSHPGCLRRAPPAGGPGCRCSAATRRGLPALPGLAAGRRLQRVRQGQAGRHAHGRRAAAMRGLPAAHRPRSRRCGSCGKTAPVAVRGRDGQPDICVNCYRLPEAVCAVLRPAPRVQLRRDQPSGLPVMLAEGDRHLRALRPGPPAPGPLARRAGLRPVLHRRAAAPRDGARPAASSGAWSSRPARTLTPAQTAPGSRSRTPAPTAGSRTSFMNAAAATGAACGAGPRRCSPDPTARSRPG